MIPEADTDWHDCRHGLPPDGVTVEVGMTGKAWFDRVKMEAKRINKLWVGMGPAPLFFTPTRWRYRK